MGIKLALVCVACMTIPVSIYAQGYASNDNFVVYATTDIIAAQILKKAEDEYTRIKYNLFGNTPFSQTPCMIHTKIIKNPDLVLAITQPKNDPRNEFHSLIMVRLTEKDLTGPVLTHEMSHLVIASRFPDLSIPRWADEGMAVIQETIEENDIAQYERYRAMAIAWAKGTDDIPDFKEMFLIEDFGSFTSEHYAASYYLTRFLLSIEFKNKDSLDAFVKLAKATKKAKTKDELDGLVKFYYGHGPRGIMSINQLEARLIEYIAEEYGIKKDKVINPIKKASLKPHSTPRLSPRR